jgi:DNA-binding response OmpR family regulator
MMSRRIQPSDCQLRPGPARVATLLAVLLPVIETGGCANKHPVDDEPNVLDLVDFNLSSHDFEMLRAASGLEGPRKARCDAPAVIVLDMMLPDLDGFSVCEILRAQPSTRDVPIVGLSALNQPMGRSRGAKISLYHWIKKGADLSPLSDCIRAALNEHLQRVNSRLNSGEQPAAGIPLDSGGCAPGRL